MRSYGSFARTNIHQIRSNGKIAMVSDINFSQTETHFFLLKSTELEEKRIDNIADKKLECRERDQRAKKARIRR